MHSSTSSHGKKKRRQIVSNEIKSALDVQRLGLARIEWLENDPEYACILRLNKPYLGRKIGIALRHETLKELKNGK